IAFSKFGAIIWLAVVVSAIVMLVPYWSMPGHSLKAAAESSYDLRSNPINALYLWIVFCLIKFVHELGHAFSCRRFGGECHELGIMFLVFIPTPYVDASSAWSFRNKWHRIFVGAAGMIVELFVASLCAFIWMNTGDPHSLIGQLSFNAMLVASFTTIVFNANPLLRYDGYYILSDYLEIPNLRQKSTEYAMGLLKRHVFGVKLQQPLPPVLQRFWLLFYAIASSIYRTFVGLVIILMVAFQIPILGMFMAIGGVVTWAVVPVYKTFKYLTIDPELHRKRGRAIAFTIFATAAAVVLVAFIPFPMNVDSVALAEAEHHEAVRPEWNGFVQKIVAKDHQWVKGNVYDENRKIVTPGDVILIADDPELDQQIESDQGQVKLFLDKITADRSASPTDVKGDESQLAAYQFELNTLLERRDKLTVRAPIDGILIAPNLADMSGRYLETGKEIAVVMDPSRLMLRLLTEQKEIGVLTSKDSRNPEGRIEDLHAEARLAADVGTVLYGERPQLQVQATTKAITSLNNLTGEEPQVDPKHPDKLMNPEFEIDVPVVNPGGRYVPGQKAWVRFKLAPRSLLWQGYRRLQQLLQTKQASPLV
ncbi:MAG TPA: site-2 protease family protein, partial [Tepidisphaeraceae bacterium]|nr:site-2 protease family protein [Tepidisphaeraceae bacterium]